MTIKEVFLGKTAKATFSLVQEGQNTFWTIGHVGTRCQIIEK
jgi:hypothetical protein